MARLKKTNVRFRCLDIGKQQEEKMLRMIKERMGQLQCQLSVKERESRHKRQRDSSTDSPLSASSQTPDQGDLGTSMDGRQQGQQSQPAG